MNQEIAPVLDEISAILKKHDMAGLIIVANKTHTDYRMEIEPSWSCAWLEHGEGNSVGVRVSSKRADYPSAAAQKESLERTVGTFVTFTDILRRLQDNMETVLVMIRRAGVDFLGKSTSED